MGFLLKRLLRTKIKTAVWPIGLSGIILPDVYEASKTETLDLCQR